MEQTTNRENSQSIKLSIQVRLNGLSFCTMNEETREVLWYQKVNFHKEYNPLKILEQIEALYNSEKQLQQPVKEVSLLFSNELYSFVPKDFFIEEEASTYLKFNTKILKTDIVAHDFLEAEDLVNVYIPYTNITNFFFDRYGEFEYQHSCSILAQEVLNDLNKDRVNVYLNNFEGYYDLAVAKGKELLLCNTFTYDTKEDFIYYLLFTAEQLKLNREELELTLLGNINEDSALYKILYTYIKNVKFLSKSLNCTSKKYQGEQFQREAFLLLKTLGCE
ncbi:DUF3822 family protein [Antarcticibacterium sp. 1MA-6-2]|uniref:DUF3822 family protein n=1 Tax=Antarcticibacterium sp. 1MA-6-2 TaxID=2908210 RepID=UPI001F3B0802|nr:DUF3822 family protein [Antarcticibacterium sp. 1MA-6-2]UJH91506.1 DUF3822 family protein [Antarcticibacterium sp. 1MA-6-2]